MESALGYQLECAYTPFKNKNKTELRTHKHTFTVHHNTDCGKFRSQVVCYSEDEREKLFRFISNLDYVTDAQPNGDGVNKKRISSSLDEDTSSDEEDNNEGSDKDDMSRSDSKNGSDEDDMSSSDSKSGSDEDDSDYEEDRPLAEEFSFQILYCEGPEPLDSPRAAVISGVVSRLVNLQQLAELDLCQCPLTEDTVYRMQFGPAYNLKVLKLEQLNLRCLHPSVGRLRSLKELSLCYNRLTDLPLTIRLLRNLRRLDITGNPFTRLPGAVYHLKLECILGLNKCPLKKDIGSGWVSSTPEIAWMRPLRCGVPIKLREDVSTLQECSIQAAVGMDCWMLELPKMISERLARMAETQGLCENCLKPVRKLTIDHESLGFTIHAQMAVFCGVRDVPFSFMACSEHCLQIALTSLAATNSTAQTVKGFSKLPSCEYNLKFVQDLEELQRSRAKLLTPNAYKSAHGRNWPRRNNVGTSSTNKSSWRCVIS